MYYESTGMKNQYRIFTVNTKPMLNSAFCEFINLQFGRAGKILGCHRKAKNLYKASIALQLGFEGFREELK
jgi:hypothetical protein